MLVTVIIPSYNHERYIEKAVMSVLEQTYHKIELIVIDDGSQDKSHSILTDLSNNYGFKYIHRENKGLIKTLNEALQYANGDYITMLGSDDFYEKEKISLQMNFLKKNSEYVLCYGNINFIDSSGFVIKQGKTKHFKEGFVFNDLLYQCFIPLPTVMIKKTVLLEYGFDERFFLEDYPLWLKISKKYKIGYIKDILTNYRLHDSNVSGNMLKMINEVERILFDWKDDLEYKKAINKWYYRWFCDLSKTEFLTETKEYMMKAMPSSFYKFRFIRSSFRYFFKKIKLRQGM